MTLAIGASATPAAARRSFRRCAIATAPGASPWTQTLSMRVGSRGLEEAGDRAVLDHAE